MAEALVGGLLNKLGGLAFDKAIEKALSVYGISGQIDKLSDELRYIHSFIEDADRKHIVNKTQMQWVNDVIDIAYDIEDAVELFHSKCPKNIPGIRGSLGRFPKKITKIPFLSEFQKKIKRIQNRINDIQTFKKRYDINTLGEDKIVEPEPKLDFVSIDDSDDSEIVGFATHAHKVVEDLLDEANRSLAVISIVGIGGLGKTTLAKKVCNRYTHHSIPQ